MKIVAVNTIVAVVKKEQVTVLPGKTVELPDAEAAALVKRGAAKRVVPDPDAVPESEVGAEAGPDPKADLLG
ncbi:hypothetical protein [Azospirillum picis]|uniref:Uncharacterized protein n=1 Tax=Azospirillum picis TaxID=488438 RepID=A0ABU0MED5_9PROT|nr:hypothetical protein [Azospirillum picis]MBP2297957.1 hypothetical protein [Azospirillum picis]MDQ0531795.1 hypothetical protein [Azospirillum picis]